MAVYNDDDDEEDEIESNMIDVDTINLLNF